MDKDLYDLYDIEIFATGTWHGEEWTATDLDDMVAAFPSVGFKPALKIGHNAKQYLAREITKEDDFPSIGRISAIKREGDKLLATFSELPKTLYNAIKRKNYHSISSEIFKNYTANGVVYPTVLKAVALLGENIPEVSTLKEVEALYSKHIKDGVTEYKFITTNREVKMDELETLKAKLAESEKKIADLMAELEKLKSTKPDTEGVTEVLGKVVALEEEVKALQAKNFSLSEKSRASEIAAWMTVNDKKILPKEKPVVEFLMSQLSEKEASLKKFSAEAGKELSAVGAFKLLIEGRDVPALLTEFGKNTNTVPYDSGISGVSSEVARKAREYQATHPTADYSTAAEWVFSQNPDLKKAYFTAIKGAN